MTTTLQQLKDHERELSRRRALLHLRIEYLRGTGAHEPGSKELLEELVLEEREVSARRREMHATIDALKTMLHAK